MRKKRVVVAMSGGVDSSVCAALLQDKGFEVVGITLQIWPGAPVQRSCCGREHIEDARRVADKLNIPHYVLNFRQIFKEKVIDDFAKEYLAGKTPNPCISCNQYIKFDALLKKARQIGAAFIATGHYARIEFNKRLGKYLLKKGLDPQKDQSYVLYTMTQGQLKRTLMPLGKLTKHEVRRIAKTKGLCVAEKKESQEICFVADNNYGIFLQTYLRQKIKPGAIINQDGKIIGQHKGIIYYTIGQRKGIGIADRQPLYVTAINKKNNTITVGMKNDVYSNSLIAEKLNLIYLTHFSKPLKVMAKVRYLHPLAPAAIYPQAHNRVKVKFDQPQWAVTPGQAVVFYQGDRVVGGGRICGS